jgi:putative heme-binding domain-containing protein
VFRTSPAEPWRIVRTRRRAADPEYQKRLPPTELVATGFFTSATGVTVYRGDAYPEEVRGNVFIGDVGGNLVHRKTLEPDGISFIATRADESVEFITSTDNWFRPVNFVNGPDGCLYILDMYRETIEHPSSIPDDIKAHLDLYSGDDRGRVYRLVPPKWNPHGVLNLAAMTSDGLVAQLNSTNAWNRETAQRLIVERGDDSAAGDVWRIVHESESPAARIHALYTLDGLGALEVQDVVAYLNDESPHVREHLIRLAEKHRDESPDYGLAILMLADDPDVRVQFQLALSLGEFEESIAQQGLAALAGQKDISPDVQQAMLTSVGPHAGEMAVALIATDIPCSGSPGELRWLERLCELAAVTGDDGVPQVLNALAATKTAGSYSTCVTNAALRGAGRGLRTRGLTLAGVLASENAANEARQLLNEHFQVMRDTARNLDESAASRAVAITYLAQDSTENLQPFVEELLSPRQPQEVQIAMVRALADHPGDDLATTLLAPWPSASPAVRAEIVDGLLRSGGRTEVLLSAIEAGDVKPGEIAPDKRQALLAHPNQVLQQRAAACIGVTSADRQEVIDRYEPALDGETDAERGRSVFMKTCANCHKVGDAGHAVGPELASVANKSPRDLMIAVLDPSREAQPIYTSYTALLDDGRIVTGIIAAETASTVTFRRAEGKEDVVLRDQIDQLQSSGQSLMPVGIEKDITAEQLADVVTYIKSLSASIGQ